MSTQKAVFIGLAVLALLVVAVLLYGQTQPGCDDPAPPPDCKAESFKPGAGTRLLGRLTGAFAPRVKTTPVRIELADGDQRSLRLPPADDPQADPRTLALQLRQGRVRLNYEDAGVQSRELARQRDDSDLPRQVDADGGQDPRAQSFVVSARGGTLRVRCQQGPCVLESQ